MMYWDIEIMPIIIIIIIIIIKRIFFKCRAVKKKLLEHFTEVKQLMTMSHVRVCVRCVVCLLRCLFVRA